MAIQKWSQDVTEHSDALDLDHDVFTLDDPKAIAASLKRSAERSRKRKGTPFQSAMSMLTFYINRAGKGGSTTRSGRRWKRRRMRCARRSGASDAARDSWTCNRRRACHLHRTVQQRERR